MKTALVHDWLVGIGGGEKVLQSIAELYPSPIYTLVKNAEKLKETFFSDQEIHTSFLQKIPGSGKWYRNFLPLFPLAIEQFDLRSYDLIVSTSHAVAKGVLTHPHQLHICYCFTPMRYAWDLYHEYLSGLGPLRKLASKWTLHGIRKWDIASLNRVDHFVCISQYVARRIKKFYGREAAVIYPPVPTHLFQINPRREDYYITVSRLVPYKKVDLIVEAFAQMQDKTLLVIGDGPEMSKIKTKASKNIQFLGHQTDAMMREYLSKAKAFVFAAEEEFGIINVEAQAAGIPVIAYGKGAALETVIGHKTGVFFDEQSVPSIMQAVRAFEKEETLFDPYVIKQHAETFNESQFKEQFKSYVDQKLSV